jgi:hypothetical protein
MQIVDAYRKKDPFLLQFSYHTKLRKGSPLYGTYYTKHPGSSIPAVLIRIAQVLFVSTAVGSGTGVPALLLCGPVLVIAG